MYRRHLAANPKFLENHGMIKTVARSPAQQFIDDDRYWTFVLTDTVGNVEIPEWAITHADLSIPPPLSVRKRTLHGGKQEGSTLIEIETEAMNVAVIPTRGMSVLAASSGDVDLGWSSPVDEVVHPKFIDLQQRGGLGWLDGFNELIVRCGFEWSGHPSAEGNVLRTLHGRSGNTPASTVVVQVEKAAPHTVLVRGLVKEKTFKFANIEVWTCLSVVPGEARFRICDEVANCSDYAQDYQIIYHTNFGPPLLGAGARVLAPAEEVSPFNDRAATELEGWDACAAPTPGYDETVFNCSLYADESGATLAALVNAEASRGVAIRHDGRQLPAFTVWKNTDTLAQGYVLGLEPGTNPPYQHAVEREQGRIRSIAPHGKVRLELAVEALTSAGRVEEVRREVESLRRGRPTMLEPRQKRDRP